jgi:inositol hexakisphosphate/diphosphoinositol-pentakisphosphate kinase
LDDTLQMDAPFSAELIDSLFPDCATSVRVALAKLGCPREALSRIHDLIAGVCCELEVMCVENNGGEGDRVESASDVNNTAYFDAMGVTPEPKVLHLSETLSLMHERWQKLNKDFKNKKTGMYDLTKVPDVYDMVRYDVLHNSHIGLSGIEELLALARDFADVVVPQEYGITKEEKISIGSKMCSKFKSLVDSFH